MHPQEIEQQQDRPYIVRRPPANGAKVAHLIGTDLFVGRVEQHRATGRTIGGMFREVESTGRMVAGVLRFRLTGIDGRGMKRDTGTTVDTSPVEVKKHIRRVRAEELSRIAEHDAELAALEEQLRDARARRAETVAEAWGKAHVVTVKELEALAASAEQLRQSTRHGMDDETRAQLAAAQAEIRTAFSRA